MATTSAFLPGECHGWTHGGLQSMGGPWWAAVHGWTLVGCSLWVDPGGLQSTGGPWWAAVYGWTLVGCSLCVDPGGLQSMGGPWWAAVHGWTLVGCSPWVDPVGPQSMGGPWWAAVYGIAESQTWLTNTFTFCRVMTLKIPSPQTSPLNPKPKFLPDNSKWVISCSIK